MAERHPREAALRRVHGTGALFSAAYGNVGSSIYYALGVVALFALGLTPVTFMIAGLIFAFTAATLHRGDGDVPGGGRVLELRASRVQRGSQLLRGVGADAQLHHHRRDLGVLRAALPVGVLGAVGARAGGRDLRMRAGRPARRPQRQGDRGILAPQPGARRRRPADPAGARAHRASPGLRPGPAGQPGRFRGGADRRGLPPRDRGGDGRLHRDRDDLEHGGGGEGREAHGAAWSGTHGRSR